MRNLTPVEPSAQATTSFIVENILRNHPIVLPYHLCLYFLCEEDITNLALTSSNYTKLLKTLILLLTIKGRNTIQEKLFTYYQVNALVKSEANFRPPEDILAAIDEGLLEKSQLDELSKNKLELVLTENGLIALREKLITFEQVIALLFTTLKLLLTDRGLAALRDKLLTPEQANTLSGKKYVLTPEGVAGFENSIELGCKYGELAQGKYVNNPLGILLTEKGIFALKHGLVTLEKFNSLPGVNLFEILDDLRLESPGDTLDGTLNEVLLRKIGVNSVVVAYDINGKLQKISPLIVATQLNIKSYVVRFLEMGADINHKIEGGATALSYAAQLGYTDILDILLKQSAQIHKLDDGASPLYLAAQNGHFDAVKYLVEYYIKNDISLDDSIVNQVQTPAMIAYANNHTDIYDYLVKHGAAEYMERRLYPNTFVQTATQPVALDRYMHAHASDSNISTEEFPRPIIQNYKCVGQLFQDAKGGVKVQLHHAVEPENTIHQPLVLPPNRCAAK